MSELARRYEAAYADIMPESVWLGLTPKSRAEVEHIMADAGSRSGLVSTLMAYELFYTGLKEGYPGRRGFAYLALATPLKYTILEHAPGELVLPLLAWDETHLDVVHGEIMGGSVEDRLFDQRLSALCAAMGNRQLSPAVLAVLTEAAEESWPLGRAEGAGDLDFAGLLHHVLWDKWSPTEFPNSTLAMLENFFRARGAASIAGEYTAEAIEAARLEYADE